MTGPPDKRTAPAVAPRGRPEVRSVARRSLSTSHVDHIRLNAQPQPDLGWQPLGSLVAQVLDRVVNEMAER